MVPDGPHNRWRSVRQENAEQWHNGMEKPRKAATCTDKKKFLVFGKRYRMIEHPGPLFFVVAFAGWRAPKKMMGGEFLVQQFEGSN